MPSIPLPSATKIIPQDKNSAIFVIEGLYPGYGVTIANSLRRILLSSLSGTAVIGVKIKDVDHEFSTIPYVYDDVVSIILNIKKIRFKMYESGVYQATLKAQGERKVKASGIRLPSEIEIVNGNSHVATLTDKRAELEITFYIKEGLGYELAEEHADDPALKEVGILKIDSIFTPVVASTFSVENMRVGQRTDYNRVKLTIQTDGTITPKEAFEKSMVIFIDQLQAVQKIEEPIKEPFVYERMREGLRPVYGIRSVERKSKKREAEREVKPELMEMQKEGKVISGRSSISHLKLTSRIEKIMLKKKIKTIGQLSKKNEQDLIKIDGIGEAAVKEIRRKLGKLGFLLSAHV